MEVSNRLAVSLDNAKAYEEIAHLKDRLGIRKNLSYTHKVG